LPRHDEVLLCEDVTIGPGLAELRTGVLLTVARGAMVRLMEAPLSVGPGLERDGPPDPSEIFHVKLELAIHSDGDVSLVEHPRAPCTHRSVLDAEPRAHDREYASKIESAVARVCAARGKYTWREHELVQSARRP
jgi:hypothetical protein